MANADSDPRLRFLDDLHIKNRGHRLPQKTIVSENGFRNTVDCLNRKYNVDHFPDWPKEIPFSQDCQKSVYVAAHLIELWRGMYGVDPAAEDPQENTALFPGFVDVACGNGMLVYILLMEGYAGWGFDAKSRRPWTIFPERVQERLLERVYVPKPFADAVDMENLGMKTYTEDFPRDTFIISLHADEVTIWTPIMAALACPESPLPFMAIPCCSVSLSGLPLQKGGTPQPASGDLKALRAAQAEQRPNANSLSSAYGMLVKKTIETAYEIGYSVEDMVVEIPTTGRNRGVFGSRLPVTRKWSADHGCSPTIVEPASEPEKARQELHEKISIVVERECAEHGGVEAAAQRWLERMRSLQTEKVDEHRIRLNRESRTN